MIRFLLKLWPFWRPYKWRLFGGVLCGLLSGAAEPLLFGTVYVVVLLVFPDQSTESIPKKALEILQKILGIFKGTDTHSTLFVVGAAAVIPIVMLWRGVVTYLTTYLMNWVSFRAINDMRYRAFGHLLNLPLSFFSKNTTGELMSRVNDIGILSGIINNFLAIVIRDPVTIISYMVLLFTMQPKLTLLTLILGPACAIPIGIYNRKVRKSSAAAQTNAAGLSQKMYEAFSGNRVIKAYNLEGKVLDLFQQEQRVALGHQMRMTRSNELPGPLMEFIGSLAAACLLIYFGAIAKTSPAGFIGFVATIFLMYRPIKNITRLYNQMESARFATERIFQMLAMTSNVVESAHPKQLKAQGADIHFDHVEFDYGDKPVLHDFNLQIKAGQVVALVGNSGSGKTTVTNLLLRFYDPNRGAIRIGGVDLRELTLKDLRNQTAIVTQETVLFNDTIHNNIALGRPGSTREDVIAAAKHAFAHDFIMRKPEGYDSMVGDRGGLLSVGQKQRISIARAILRDAPILILDEATSSLDNESERAVQAALEELMKGRTTICIAHRLSTIHNADKIVVLQEGRIVETGTHKDLMHLEGTYHKLYSLNFQKTAVKNKAE